MQKIKFSIYFNVKTFYVNIFLILHRCAMLWNFHLDYAVETTNNIL